MSLRKPRLVESFELACRRFVYQLKAVREVWSMSPMGGGEFGEGRTSMQLALFIKPNHPFRHTAPLYV
jgi:hypothetical protein